MAYENHNEDIQEALQISWYGILEMQGREKKGQKSSDQHHTIRGSDFRHPLLLASEYGGEALRREAWLDQKEN